MRDLIGYVHFDELSFSKCFCHVWAHAQHPAYAASQGELGYVGATNRLVHMQVLSCEDKAIMMQVQ